MPQYTSQNHSIFISYSRDLETIKALTQDLEGLGYSVWFDQAVTGGQHWWDHILGNIRECEVFVVALTSDLLETEACREELNYAYKLGKSVLPVLLSDNVNASHLSSHLREIQYVDYRQLDKEAFKQLLRAIKDLPSPRQLPDPLPEPPPLPVFPVSYLGSLKEQVESVKQLSFAEQVTIVLNVKKRLADSNSPVELKEIRDLLDRLRQRDDLLAKTADEIDTLMGRIKAKPPSPELAPAPELTLESSSQTKAISAAIKARSEETLIALGGKQYKIFQNPLGLIEAVKQGWSWPAFFFNCIWALFKKMWGLGAGLFTIYFTIELIGVIVAASEEATIAAREADARLISVITTIVSLIVSAGCGKNGNSWRESNLQARGYELKTTVTAASPEGAVALYLKQKHEQ